MIVCAFRYLPNKHNDVSRIRAELVVFNRTIEKIVLCSNSIASDTVHIYIGLAAFLTGYPQRHRNTYVYLHLASLNILLTVLRLHWDFNNDNC